MKISKNIIISVIATVIVAGGGGFYGGMAYAKSKTPGRGNFTFAANGNGASLNGNRAAGRQGIGMVSGEILSKDEKSITVKDRSGGSKIVFFAPSTSVGKMTQGTDGDLAAGMNVTATGTSNSDGTITAQNIQIRPEGAAAGMPGLGGQRQP